jgi:hypothetical protein
LRNGRSHWQHSPVAANRKSKPKCKPKRNRDGQGLNMHSPIIRIASIAAIAAGLNACSDGGSSIESPAPGPIAVGAATLKHFTGDDACQQLEAKIESVATAMMSEQLSYLRDRQPGNFYPPPVAEGNTGDSGAPVAAPAPAPARYSETNVQVGGVDEPDLVKNTGEHLYSLALGASGDEIVLSQVALRPADSMRLVGQNRWSAVSDPASYQRNSPQGMFLNGANQLVSLSTGYQAVVIDVLANDVAPSICSEQGCGPGRDDLDPPTTTVRSFAVGANTPPAESWKLELPGRLLQARRIGDKMYLASRATMRYPQGLKWWPEQASPDMTVEQWNAAIDALIAKNAVIVEQAPLSEWLSTLQIPGETVTAPTAQLCSSFATPESSTRLGWLRIHTVDLATQAVTHQTLMTSGSSLYMSPSALLVTTSVWSDVDRPGSTTLVHRFNVQADGTASYDTSGKLDGTLINSFAIDQSDRDVIRVAMQDRSASAEVFSYVATMGKRDNELTVLGRSEPIAPGENLQSARFVGDKAYLVTFLQVDPFFVYDLSDPTAPTRLGELKIPGFSSYLHPIGENHVLGVGYDGGGWPRQVKASLFNVTDPMNPTEQSVLILGDYFTGSRALWDPHAFTFYDQTPSTPDTIMAIPMRSYASSSYGTQNQTDIRLINIAPDQGSGALTLSGVLDMSDLLNPNNGNGAGDQGLWRSRDARRAVFVADEIYGVADGAVRAATIVQPDVPLDTVLIP